MRLSFLGVILIVCVACDILTLALTFIQPLWVLAVAPLIMLSLLVGGMHAVERVMRRVLGE